MAYNVILIDDEPWTREVIKSLGDWEGLGLSVAGEASDGEYGLELIRRLKPDVIITDIKMPHMDGISMIRNLREADQRARVIVISGYDDFAFVRGAMHLGVTDYLLKPVKPDELNSQLARCVAELDAQKHTQPEQAEGLDGFLNISWIGEYLAQRTALLECLRLKRQDVLANCLERMQLLPGKSDDGSMPKGLLVALYYDLMGMLQRYIVGEGFAVPEILTKEETAFVFSRETTYQGMLCHVQKVYLQAVEGMERQIRARGRLDVDGVVQYVRENASQGITLEETAAHFYVSREYLSKVFKNHTGDSFSDFVMRLRMEKAKALLCDMHIPPKEAAEMTGFSDPAHFHKSFKRFYGMTPGEMAKSGG